MDNRYDFVETLNSDFGNRSKNASMLSDVYGIMPAINLAIKNVKKWSKDEKKSSNFPFGLLGAKSYIRYEPLGTVGMISPWNFPVNQPRSYSLPGKTLPAGQLPELMDF